MFSRTALFLFALGMFAVSASAQQEPFAGTWKQNMTKSKFEPPPATPGRGNMHEIEAVANGVRVVTRGVNAQGQPTGSQWTAYYDGKDYAMKDLSGTYDAISLKKTGPRSFEAISKKGGKSIRTSQWSVSDDGKTLSRVSKFVDAQGVSHNDLFVYDRQ